MEHEGDEAWNAIDTPPPKKNPKREDENGLR